MNIGEQIRHYRQHSGLTQSQLAKRVGVSEHSVISNYERGITLPSVRTLASISTHLGGCVFIVGPSSIRS